MLKTHLSIVSEHQDLKLTSFTHPYQWLDKGLPEAHAIEVPPELLSSRESTGSLPTLTGSTATTNSQWSPDKNLMKQFLKIDHKFIAFKRRRLQNIKWLHQGILRNRTF